MPIEETGLRPRFALYASSQARPGVHLEIFGVAVGQFMKPKGAKLDLFQAA
jgi:hypothetical protein